MTLSKTILPFLSTVISTIITACSSVGNYTCQPKLIGSHSDTSTYISSRTFFQVSEETAELECLKYAQRLRKYTNRQTLAASPTDTDESKPEKKKRGRQKNVVDDDAIMSDPITPDSPSLPPSPA